MWDMVLTTLPLFELAIHLLPFFPGFGLEPGPFLSFVHSLDIFLPFARP
jgi:hypothetical protein